MTSRAKKVLSQPFLLECDQQVSALSLHRRLPGGGQWEFWAEGSGELAFRGSGKDTVKSSYQVKEHYLSETF